MIRTKQELEFYILADRMMNRGVKSMADIYKMPKETQNYVPKVMSYYRGFANGN